jgi:hypothetical protein
MSRKPDGCFQLLPKTFPVDEGLINAKRFLLIRPVNSRITIITASSAAGAGIKTWTT